LTENTNTSFCCWLLPTWCFSNFWLNL